jgi:hypothetical protein
VTRGSNVDFKDLKNTLFTLYEGWSDWQCRIHISRRARSTKRLSHAPALFRAERISGLTVTNLAHYYLGILGQVPLFNRGLFVLRYKRPYACLTFSTAYYTNRSSANRALPTPETCRYYSLKLSTTVELRILLIHDICLTARETSNCPDQSTQSLTPRSIAEVENRLLRQAFASTPSSYLFINLRIHLPFSQTKTPRHSGRCQAFPSLISFIFHS